jgi:hypothetical protein
MTFVELFWTLTLLSNMTNASESSASSRLMARSDRQSGSALSVGQSYPKTYEASGLTASGRSVLRSRIRISPSVSCPRLGGGKRAFDGIIVIGVGARADRRKQVRGRSQIAQNRGSRPPRRVAADFLDVRLADETSPGVGAHNLDVE